MLNSNARTLHHGTLFIDRPLLRRAPRLGLALGFASAGPAQTNKRCNVRALNHKVKCDCSLQRIRSGRPSEEILIHIDMLDNKKSNDTYDIPVHIIKLSKHIIAPVLTSIFNNCIAAGIYPDALKVAKVIPIHKSGDTSNPSNYRPISVLPHFSKIFEKIC